MPDFTYDDNVDIRSDWSYPDYPADFGEDILEYDRNFCPRPYRKFAKEDRGKPYVTVECPDLRVRLPSGRRAIAKTAVVEHMKRWKLIRVLEENCTTKTNRPNGVTEYQLPVISCSIKGKETKECTDYVGTKTYIVKTCDNGGKGRVSHRYMRVKRLGDKRNFILKNMKKTRLSLMQYLQKYQ